MGERKTWTFVSSTGKQKLSYPSSRQHPATRRPTDPSKVERIGLRNSTPSTWFLVKPLQLNTATYSPYLSPMDYHFFNHLDNFLREKYFKLQTDAKTAFNEFIASRCTDFYSTGITKRVTCWQKCIDCNGFILVNKVFLNWDMCIWI